MKKATAFRRRTVERPRVNLRFVFAWQERRGRTDRYRVTISNPKVPRERRRVARCYVVREASGAWFMDWRPGCHVPAAVAHELFTVLGELGEGKA